MITILGKKYKIYQDNVVLTDLLDGLKKISNIFSLHGLSDENTCSIYTFCMESIVFAENLEKLSCGASEVVLLPGIMLIIDQKLRLVVMFVDRTLNIKRELVLLLPYISNFIFQDEIMVFHGAAIKCLNNNSNVALFLGESGAGKTTISNLAFHDDLSILSDELNFVFFDKKTLSFWVQSAGIYSEDALFHAESEAFPLSLFVELKKGCTTTIENLSPTNMLALLDSNEISYPKSFKIDYLYFSIISNIPFIRMEFSKHTVDWHMLDVLVT